jgi:hypothetical protein
VDGTVLVGVDRTSFVDGLADNINDSAKCLGTDWHHDGMSSVQNCLSSNQTLSGVQSYSAHVVATKMLGDFQNETRCSPLDLKSVENGRQLSFKLYVYDGTNNLRNLSVCFGSSGKATYTAVRKRKSLESTYVWQ